MRTSRITARGWSLVAATVVLIVVGRVLGSVELLCAGIVGCAAFVGAALFTALVPRPVVHLERRLPSRAFSDAEITVELDATAIGRRASTLLVHEHVSPDVMRTLGLAPMRRGTTRTLRYRTLAGARGTQQIGPAVLTRTDPLGLMVRRVGECPPSTMTVWPAPAEGVSLPSVLHNGEAVLGGRRRGGDRDLTDLRNYEDGDDLRRIHWRTSARVGELMVRTDGLVDEDTQPLVVVDARSHAHSSASLELALSIAAGLMLREGYEPTVMVATAREVATYRDATNLLDALAVIPHGGRGSAHSSTEPLSLPAIHSVPDAVIAGPRTMLAGWLARSPAVLRCHASGSSFAREDASA